MQNLLLSYYFDISIHEVFYNIASSVQRLEECFLERLPSILMNDNKPIKIMNFIHPDYLPYCGEDESCVTWECPEHEGDGGHDDEAEGAVAQHQRCSGGLGVLGQVP